MGLYGNNIFIDEHVRFINEAYFGKLPFLLEVEEAIHELRKPENLDKFKDLDASAPVQRINRLMEQGFGMECFSLQIKHNDTVNAYTIPVAIRYDVAIDMNINELVYATQSEGYRFKPNNNLCIICVIYRGLLMVPELTDSEIVAIMLHELGHNFTDAIYKKIRIANKKTVQYCYQYYFIIAIYMAFCKFKPLKALKFLSFWSKKKNNSIYQVNKNKNIKYNPIRGIKNTIGGTITDMRDFCKGVIKRYFQFGKAVKNKRMIEIFSSDNNINKKSFGRIDEVIADKFAGVYGYGPEQGSALLKMEKCRTKAAKFVDKLPGGKEKNRKYDQLWTDYTNWDEHPHHIQRINEEIKVLEFELKKGCDPKYATMIKSQIAQLKQLIKDASTIMKEFNEDEKAKALYNAYINNQEPLAVDEEIEDEINNALDALLTKDGEEEI